MAPPAPAGLYADVQVAHLPFERNWHHLASDPSFLFLEVGANNHELERDFLEPMLQDHAGGFLISFEPLLDKYGFLLSHRAPSQDFMHLGLQHRRALVLPHAVSTCRGATATFHVSPLDGCSSLRAPAGDFKQNNRDETRYSRSWPKWVEENCTALAERREVPCISLATVLGEWLHGRPIARMKIDAQGSDLDVVKSAGPFVRQLLYVVMEAQGTFEASLYEGQAKCDEIQNEMSAMGFILADTRTLPACNGTEGLPEPFHEEDIAFIRHELRHLWRRFYHEHPYCQQGVVSASGACGGPYCLVPSLGMHVNRSGGCDLIQDSLVFDDSVGLVLLGTTDACWSHVQVGRDHGGNVTVQVLQGPARGRRRCAAKFVAVQSVHGPLIRIRSGTDSSDFRVRLLLLPGILHLSPRKFEEVFEYFLQIVEGSGTLSFQLVWPCSCAELSARSLPILTNSFEPVPSSSSKSGNLCIMEKTGNSKSTNRSIAPGGLLDSPTCGSKNQSSKFRHFLWMSCRISW